MTIIIILLLSIALISLWIGIYSDYMNQTILISFNNIKKKLYKRIKKSYLKREKAFCFDDNTIDKILDKCENFSLLAKYDTLYQVYGKDFPILCVQLVPKTNDVTPLCTVVTTLLSNIAIARGFSPETETELVPDKNNTLVLHIGIATNTL